ncbi:MAG: hypothetical protein R3F56_05980 [Planctomycetota bacterium]
MIRINLLPEEFRRADRTSPKVFAASLAALILVCCAGGWFGLCYFGELGELEIKQRNLIETMTAKNEMAKYSDALVADKQAYEMREATIRQIGSSRMLWTEFMDQLIDVVNNEGNTQRHLAWFQSIQVAEGSERQGPVITLPGQVQGNLVKKVADFHDDIENAPFAKDLLNKSAPSGERKNSPKRNPPESYAFNLQLTMKPAQEWAKNKAEAAKPAK